MTDEIFDDGRKKSFEERERRRRNKELSDLKTLLNTVEGRRFLWRVLSETGIFRTCFDQNALSMAMKEGRRDIGIWVLSDIQKVSFELLSRMQREAESDQQSEEAEFKKQEKKRLEEQN